MSVATLKYYLREELLPPGRRTAPNQAHYDQDHVHRVRLVRVLREVGELSIEAIRDVVAAMEDPSRSRHAMVGTAHRALADPHHDPPPAPARAEVDRWIDEDLGWRVGPDAPGRDDLARTLASLRRLGRDVDATVFDPYASAVRELAEAEVAATTDAASGSRAIEATVVGTVVFEAALVTLRRLAHEHVSATLDHAGAVDDPVHTDD